MFHQALGCLFGQTLWYWGNDLDPGIMYFPTKWGAFFHRIHGTGIYTYMKTMKINHPYMGVSKYPSRILKNLLHRMREVSFPPKRKIALPDTFGTSDGTWFSFENNKIRVEFMELGPEAKNPSANSNLSWPQEISVLFIFWVPQVPTSKFREFLWIWKLTSDSKNSELGRFSRWFFSLGMSFFCIWAKARAIALKAQSPEPPQSCITHASVWAETR